MENQQIPMFPLKQIKHKIPRIKFKIFKIIQINGETDLRELPLEFISITNFNVQRLHTLAASTFFNAKP